MCSFLELIRYTTSDFWVFLGVLILLSVIADSLVKIIGGLTIRAQNMYLKRENEQLNHLLFKEKPIEDVDYDEE